MANLVPKVNNTGSIGTNAKKWSNVHTTTLSLGAQNAPLSLNSQRITDLSDPTALTDAATKSYVDNAIQGLSAKDSVRAATTEPVTLATAFANGQAIDGVTLATGDRILIKDQTAGAENGVYTVNASGAPTRAGDFDSNDQVEKGAYIFVEEGTVNANSGFVLTTDGSITLGTTSLSFSQFSGAGQITAGSGITKSGNTLAADIAGLSAIASMAASDVLMIADVDDNNNLKKITRANFIADITSEVIDDSSPQLGGDLDVQTHKIVSTSDRDITLAPHGTGDVFVEDALVKFNPYGGLSFNSNNISDPGLTVTHYEDGFNPTRRYQGLSISSTGNNNAYPMLTLSSTSPVDNSGNASTTGPVLRLHNRQNSSNGEVTGAIYFGSGNASFTQPCSISAIYDTASGSRASSISLTHYVAGSYKSVLVKNNSLIIDSLATFGVGTIDLKNDGSAVSSIKLYCQSNNSHYTQIQSALHASYGGGNVTLTLPTATGTLLSSGDTGTVTSAMLAGSIAASKLNGEIFPDLETLGAPSSDGEFIVATGAGAFAYESGATVRTSLGLGSGDNVSFASLALSGQAAPLAMNTQKITGLGAPQAASDAATKAYVDQVAQGLDVKDSVVAATTASFAASTVGTTDTITLSNGEGGFSTAAGGSLTIDGVSITQGDRILIKDGVNENNAGVSQAKNGIYTVGPLGGPLCSLTRSSDMDSTSGVTAGSFCFVEQGNANADIGFVITTDGSITIGTTSITFAQFSGAGSVTAGAALTKTGNTLDVAVNSSGGLEINNDELRVKAAGITSAMLAGSIANSKLNQLTTANKVALSSLDLDGGTDIGADLVDADLIVVDDGAGGTNRKSALSRIKKYIFSSVSGDATATDSGAFTVSSSGTALTDITAGSGAATLATSGDININSTTNGADIIFNGKNNGGGALQLLKLHGQDATYGWGYCEIYGNVTSQSVIPKSSGFYNLGSTTNRWGNVYLSDSKSIFFGNDQEIELKHDPDDGLILKMIGSTSYDPSLVLTSDSAGTTGPKLVLRHDSSSPADNDEVGRIEFTGDDSAGNLTSYGFISGYSSAVASGSEVGKIVMSPYQASNNTVGLSVEGIAGASTKVKVNIDAHNGVDSGLHLGGTLITASAAEINLLDGATSAQATTLVDADRVIVNDAGTMKQVALSDVKTYVNAGSDSSVFEVKAATATNTDISPTNRNGGSAGAPVAWFDVPSPLTVDGVTINLGDKILVKNNHGSGGSGAGELFFSGVYYYKSLTGSTIRLELLNGGAFNYKIHDGFTVYVREGTANANKIFARAKTVYRNQNATLAPVNGVAYNYFEAISNSSPLRISENSDGKLTHTPLLANKTSGTEAVLVGQEGHLATILGDSSAGESGAIKLNCEQNSHGVTIQGPAHSANATYTLTLPTSNGNANQVLETDGNGVLSWVDQSGGASFSSVGENILPSAANTYSLGSAAAEWSDLYMGDGSRIYFGNDQDVFLEHEADTGLILDLATDTATKPYFTLKTANDSVGAGSTLRFLSETASPATNDIIATIDTQSKNSNGGDHSYGDIRFKIESATNNSEAGGIYFYPSTGGFPAGNVATEALKVLGNSSGHTIVDVAGHDGANSGLKLGGTLVTSTAAELNLLDGATSAQATTLQSTDRVIVNDSGVMKQVALSDVKTYVASGTFEAQAIELGDLLLNYSGSSNSQYLRLTMADNSSNGEPIFLIENDTTSSSGGKLAFSIKEANSNTVGDGDTLGTLEWRETASNGGASYWCYQLGKVLDHTNNYGSLEFQVRSGNTSPATALSIEGSAGGTLIDIEDHDGSDSGLKLGGTLVTSTAAELNSLDVSAQSPSDNEVLTYTAASGLHWAAAGGGGGGGGSATIPDVQVVTGNTSAAFASSGSNGDNERVYLVNNTGAVTITLPAISGNTGKKFQIKRIGTANVTIAVQTSEYLEGAQNGTFVLSSQYSSVTIVGNASGTSDGWYII